jgi:hypothetical protein
MKMSTNSYYVQQGSSGLVHTRNENMFYVIRETWSGSQIVNTTIMSAHDTEAEAFQAKAALETAEA